MPMEQMPPEGGAPAEGQAQGDPAGDLGSMAVSLLKGIDVMGKAIMQNPNVDDGAKKELADIRGRFASLLQNLAGASQPEQAAPGNAPMEAGASGAQPMNPGMRG